MRFILAVSEDDKIGIGNKIPWHIPHDLKWFKMNTYGETVIMGRKTWDSIGRRPLKERKNIVISRTRVPRVTTFRTIREVENYTATYPNSWVIGGASICQQLWKGGDILLLTRVHVVVPNGLSVKLPPIRELWSKEFDTHTFSINIIQSGHPYSP